MFMVMQGCYELLESGGIKMLAMIPQLIIPVEKALNTRDPGIMAITMKLLQKLVMSAALVPQGDIAYVQSIQEQEYDIGGKIYYSQRKKLSLGNLIQETFEYLEQTGEGQFHQHQVYDVDIREPCADLKLINLYTSFIFY